MMLRFVTFLLWLLRREKHDIGRKGLPDYLTRWTLLGQRFKGDGGKLFLHCFYRGDAEAYCHDHPWPFWSLILWGGYWEITPGVCPADAALGKPCQMATGCGREEPVEKRAWYGPLSLLRRPAEWAHRVELPPGKRCWSLVWTGPKARSWGFHCPGKGWIPWKVHQANQEAGGPGCG